MAQFRRLMACLILCLLAAPALSERRVALVIGNSAYRHAPALTNPKNDAESVAAALKRLNFDVSIGIDLDKTGMQTALRAFARKLDGAAVALVFYAGHGLQVNGENYVIPVDAKLEQEADLRWEAISLASLMQDMEQVPRTTIVILDACRDNPLARSLARTMGTRSTAVGRGLAPVQGGTGTMIVFATGPGTVALDGEGGRHSPFTAALLAHMETPGLEIRQVLTRVRVNVARATSNKQVPWVTESLLGDFFFAATPGTAPSTPPTPDQESLFWQSIKDSRNLADYKAYLDRWPTGAFASLARLRIAEIEKARATPPGTVFRDCSGCPELIVVPAGTFVMGSPSSEESSKADERPQHSVSLVSIALGKFEVTRGEWTAFVREAGDLPGGQCYDAWGVKTSATIDWRNAEYPQTERHPVVCVSWDDANAYLRWLSRKTGKHYRLPSEAEWEYAARAGTESSRPWGDDPEGACRHANAGDASYRRKFPQYTTTRCDDGYVFTAPVGSFRANRFGLHDMLGNVIEWVEDCWNADYVGAPGDGRAWNSGKCDRRVMRSSNWGNERWFVRSANRMNAMPSARNNLVGFRVARPLD